MSKRQTQSRKPNGGKRQKVIVAVLLTTVLVAVTGILAQQGSKGEKKVADGEVGTTSFAANQPSKEYVYAGGRLVATEEPTTGGGQPTLYKLCGATFGTSPPWAIGSEFDKAFDGNTATFFDYINADGGYTGIDLGSGNTRTILKIRYFPRSDWAGGPGRMEGGRFQGSNSGPTSGFVDLHTVLSAPTINTWVEVTVSTSAYRYLRYLSPDGGYGNVAEVEFYSDTPACNPIVPGSVTIGLYAVSGPTFHLRNSNSAGAADLTFGFGNSEPIPLAGDWNNDGTDTIGVYNPTTSTFSLRYTNSPGGADLSFVFGPAGAGWLPIVGDWNNDGTDTIGLFNPTTSTFFLKDSNSAGSADLTFAFGPAPSGWKPLAGDWNNDGVDTIGLYDPTTANFFLRNSNSAGAADLTFSYGPAGAGWLPLAGDWDGIGDDTIGLYNPATSTFFLRNTNSAGAADLTFVFGPAGLGWVPLAGDWDGQ